MACDVWAGNTVPLHPQPVCSASPCSPSRGQRRRLHVLTGSTLPSPWRKMADKWSVQGQRLKPQHLVIEGVFQVSGGECVKCGQRWGWGPLWVVVKIIGKIWCHVQRHIQNGNKCKRYKKEKVIRSIKIRSIKSKYKKKTTFLLMVCRSFREEIFFIFIYSIFQNTWT